MKRVIDMNCENCFCIYQYSGVCRLDRIELDIQGKCTSCIYLDIDEQALEHIKENSRR